MGGFGQQFLRECARAAAQVQNGLSWIVRNVGEQVFPVVRDKAVLVFIQIRVPLHDGASIQVTGFFSKTNPALLCHVPAGKRPLAHFPHASGILLALAGVEWLR